MLPDAAASGMLTLEEVDERLSELYTSRFTYMLDALVVDLPEPAKMSTVMTGSIADHARQVFTALLGLGLALAMLANRHRKISIAFTVVLVAAMVIVVGFGGESHHEMLNRQN